MKKSIILGAMAMGLIASSCSQDEPMAPLSDARTQINFSATAESGSRSASSYENGTDVSEISVSAWMRQDASVLPGYSSGNTGNAAYFVNDFLTRTKGSSGTFNYASDARFWPSNGETLDFYAVVDNKAWGEDNGRFAFNANDGKPGLVGNLAQLPLDKMPDLLYATTFGQKLNRAGSSTSAVYQKNVSLRFYHAFAKVHVTAEVRNKNIRVVITDMELHGIAKEGQFLFPYLSGSGSLLETNGAHWIIPDNYTQITDLLKFDALDYTILNGRKSIVLDKKENGNIKAKHTLISEAAPNDLLVLPRHYNGRNSSGKYQTYILLKGYAYNIADSEAGWDEDTDCLIYPKSNADGSVTPAAMIIPIEFKWDMGTINHYNIVFDCGNGGNTTEDPNNPAFIRIGYEVEVQDWETGEQKCEHEENGVNQDNSIQYPNNIK